MSAIGVFHRSFIVGLAALLIGAGFPVAAAGEKVHLSPRWKVGDVYDIQVKRSGLHKKAGRVVKSGKVTANVKAIAREATPRGFVIEWRTMGLDVEKSTGGGAEALAAASKLAQKFTLLIELDSDGTPTGLRNLPQLRAQAGEVARLLTPAGASERERAEAVSALQQALASDANANAIFLKDPILFFAPMGLQMRVGESMPIDADLPNPLGGPAFAATGAIVLESYDASSGRATFASQLRFNPERTSVVVRDMARKLLPPGPIDEGEEPLYERAAREFNLEVDDRAEHIVDVSTGWPASVRHRRLVTAGGDERMDGLWFTSKKR